MTNKQDRLVPRFDVVSGYMQKWPEGEYVFHSDYLALLDELEAKDALNKHLELAIRKAEGCSEALRRRAEAAEKRAAELEAREVNLPSFDGYVSHIAKELQAAFRIACADAGIRINGEG